MRDLRKQDKMTDYQKKICMNNTTSQYGVIQTLDLSDKNFKIPLINMFKN